MFDYHNFFTDKLDAIKSDGRYRYFQSLKRHQGQFPTADYKGRTVTVWCSNDYLGMGQHPVVLDAMRDAIHETGAGAGGTRNISGTHPYHESLEQSLADLHGKPKALVFTSGYVANMTALSTLGKIPDMVILSDNKNHASMIEGIRHSRCEKMIFSHNDMDDLESKLRSLPTDTPKIVAFESVYSMDGDFGKISEIVKLAQQYGALTYLDEVHAVGMYGACGAGVADRDGVMDKIDIINGTLGKAYGVMGGYIAANKEIIDYVRSFGSGFIFSTSMSPVIAAGARAAVEYLKTPNGESLRQKQRKNLDLFDGKMKKSGIDYVRTPSHIFLVMIKDAKKCREISAQLLDQGYYVQAINYPTVPVGTERLRITLTPLHTSQMMDDFIQNLRHIFDQVANPSQ